MLVLQRGRDERLQIGEVGSLAVWDGKAWKPIDPIVLTVVGFRKGAVRIGVDAHKAVAIHRPETEAARRAA